MALAAASRSIKLALIQLGMTSNKGQMLEKTRKLIEETASQGAKIVALPECFNSPYGLENFANFAESIPGESTEMLSQVARDTKLHIVGGSIPELSGGKLYNTCTIFGPDGTMLGIYRKVHLADIDIPGRMTFIESSVLSPGNKLTTFQAGPCKVGIGICYDLRFQQIAQLYEQDDCNLLIYPAVFNVGTGPSHWELLLRARALDHKMFVAGCNVARDDDSSYVAYGQSRVVNPWGTVVASAGDGEEIIYANIVAISAFKATRSKQINSNDGDPGRGTNLWSTIKEDTKT